MPKMCEKKITGDKYSFHEPSDKNILGTGGNGKVSLISGESGILNLRGYSHKTYRIRAL